MPLLCLSVYFDGNNSITRAAPAGLTRRTESSGEKANRHLFPELLHPRRKAAGVVAP